MPSTTSLYRRQGAFQLPYVAADASATGSLAILDPARDILLGLFEAAIVSELAGVWNVLRTGSPLASSAVVQTTLAQEPSIQVIRALKVEFPLLAVYREEGNGDEYTLAQDRLSYRWAIDYVLGPLPPEDRRRLGDTVTAVGNIVRMCVTRGGHAAYQSGAAVLGPGAGTAQFSYARLRSMKHGPARFAGDEDQTVYATSLVLETEELEYPVAGTEGDYAGASLDFGTGGEAGVVPGLVLADTSVPRQ